MMRLLFDNRLYECQNCVTRCRPRPAVNSRKTKRRIRAHCENYLQSRKHSNYMGFVRVALE
jgi:hypothetical protein